MNGNWKSHTTRPDVRPQGFTLVELLVVITIIGILAGLATKGISAAIRASKEASILMEVDGLSQAMNSYQQKYGDYPPDFSNWTIVERHYRKAFPKILNTELELLVDLVYPPQLYGGTDFTLATVKTSAPSDPQGIDRAESIVFALGGFSKDPQHPFTGDGGPLAHSQSWTTANAADLTYYQYNTDRPNSLYDFQGRLLLTTITDPHNSSKQISVSSDEELLDGSTAYIDILPVFHSRANNTPYVYFSSRTYDFAVTRDRTGVTSTVSSTSQNGTDTFFNYYTRTNLIGIARPYKSATVNTLVSTISNPVLAAYAGTFYERKDTFQIISAGIDGEFGGALSAADNSIVSSALPATNLINRAHYGPVLYSFPSGNPFSPTVSCAEFTRYSAGEVTNGQIDNITNFSGKTLENAIE